MHVSYAPHCIFLPLFSSCFAPWPQCIMLGRAMTGKSLISYFTKLLYFAAIHWFNGVLAISDNKGTCWDGSHGLRRQMNENNPSFTSIVLQLFVCCCLIAFWFLSLSLYSPAFKDDNIIIIVSGNKNMPARECSVLLRLVWPIALK